MDDTARAQAVQLLGRFNDDLTRVIDGLFGTRWAEIEEIIALIMIMSDHETTTRRLSEVSGLHRRAVSRLIARLAREGVVETRPSESDRRVVEVVLTEAGEDRAASLRAQISDFFRTDAGTALAISEGLRIAPDVTTRSGRRDLLELLLDVSSAGASLVRYMPPAARYGRMAARQRAALVYIATYGPVRPGALVAPLEVSAPGVTYLVDQLCDKGFVERRRTDEHADGRAVVLVASRSGLEAVTAVATGIEEQRQLLSDLFAEVAVWHESDASTR